MKRLLLIMIILSQSTFLFADNIVEFVGDGHVSVIVEQEEEVWYGTLENGVCRWNKSDETTTCFTSDNSALTNNEIKDLFFDANGDWWASTTDAVFRFSDDSWVLMNDSISGLFAQQSDGTLYVLGNFELHTYDGTNWTDFDMTQVVQNACCAVNDAIHVDANDNLWIAHHDFYQYATLRFDGVDWIVYALNDYAASMGQWQPTAEMPIESYDDNTLFIDNDNTIWTGNWGGLQQYQNNEWNGMYQDADWTSSNESLTILTDGEDTLRGTPFNITQDLDDWIWLTTGQSFSNAFEQLAYFDGSEWQILEDIFAEDLVIKDMEASQFEENHIYVGTNEGLAIIRKEVLLALDDGLSVNAEFRLFLEGNYLGDGTMSTFLQEQNLIELTQPYSGSPYLYNGTESVSTIPSGVVDWVLVEARAGIANANSERNTITIETQAGFLMEDGNIRDLDGNSGLTFHCLLPNEAYHFAIRHRNHLDVLTSVPINPTTSTLYDFTIASEQALGVGQLKESEDGVFVLYGGDFTQDGVIQVSDYDNWALEPAVVGTYSPSDGNLDGVIQSTDYDLWFVNKAKLGIGEIGF